MGLTSADMAAGFAHAGKLDTLEQILRAGYDIVEIIVQDEYTHDVVTTRTAAPASGAPGFLVFDTT